MDNKVKKLLEDDVRAEDFIANFRPIVDCIGIRASLELCKMSGGLQQYIPLYDQALRPARKRAVVSDYLKGDEIRQIALRYNMVESTVREIVEEDRRARRREEFKSSQGALFE